LTWDEDESDVSGIAGYNIYRNGEITALNGDELITTNSYLDENLVDGTYYYEIEAIDKASNVSGKARSNIVDTSDTIAPVLTLLGDKDQIVVQNGFWSEPGAKASDNFDTDFSNIAGDPPVIIITGSIDTSKLGKQTLEYVAIDSHDNKSEAQTRTVTVVLPIDFQVKQIDTKETINVVWHGVGSVEGPIDGYNIYLNGILSKYVPAQNTTGDINLAYSSDINVQGYSKYGILVKAVKGTAVSNNAETKAVELVEPQPVVVPVTSPAPEAPVTVAPQRAKAAAPQPAEQKIEAPADQDGKIKGEEQPSAENNGSDKVNWTPWIVLFILIILAGAATGGYFYWFNSEDEDIKTIVKETKKEIKEEPKQAQAAAAKPAANQQQAKKKNNKKQKRW
jgi:hypothetical protein